MNTSATKHNWRIKKLVLSLKTLNDSKFVNLIQEPPRSGISLGFRVENSVQILQPFNDVNVLTRNFCFFFDEFQSTKHFGRAFKFPILLLCVLRVLNSCSTNFASVWLKYCIWHVFCLICIMNFNKQTFCYEYLLKKY